VSDPGIRLSLGERRKRRIRGKTRKALESRGICEFDWKLFCCPIFVIYLSFWLLMDVSYD
jgi:hypothetical protein